MVLLPLPRRVRLGVQALLLRVLPEVHALQEDSRQAHAQVPSEEAAGEGDLRVDQAALGEAQESGLLPRDRRRQGQAVLPELVPPVQALLGPQDVLLRRGALLVLRFDREGCAGAPHRGVLQQGEELPGGLQSGLHSHAAQLPEEGLRQTPDRFLLRAEQAGGQGRHPGEALIGPRAGQLPVVLDSRPPRAAQGLQGEPVDQGPFHAHRHPDGGHRPDPADVELGQVLQGPAHPERDAEGSGRAPQGTQAIEGRGDRQLEDNLEAPRRAKLKLKEEVRGLSYVIVYSLFV
mmetsp:Transcript_1159/g.4053  ORF Transcript_1159/g.4053 Transcript_1159/m.4053 type:complete len:290 (+) Transcript_1159:649-1518(+)